MKFANAHGTIGNGMLLGKQTFFPDASLGGGLKDYAFYTSPAFKDLISGQPMQTTLDAGRPLPDNNGNVAGLNEPVLGENGLYSYGSYTNLLKWSEDLSNAVWKKRGTLNIDNTENIDPFGENTAIQLSGFGLSGNDIYQLLSGNQANTKLSLSFWIKRISTSGTLEVLNSYGIGSGQWHIDLAALPDDWVFVTKNSYAVEVLAPFKNTADGTAGITFRSLSETSFTIQLAKIQLTESPYALPYIKTEDSQVSVPPNYSDENGGYKWPIGYADPSLDSDNWEEVDGVELVQNGGFDTDTNWTKTGEAEINNGSGRVYSSEGSLSQLTQSCLQEGLYYKVMVEVVNLTSGRMKILGGGVLLDIITVVGSYEYKFKATNDNVSFARTGGACDVRIDNSSVKQIQPSAAWKFCGQNLLDALDGKADGSLENSGSLVSTNRYQIITTETDHFGTGVVAGDRITGQTTALDANNTVKQISPAQGEMQVEWIPEFNTADISGVINILTAKDEVISFLEYDADNLQLKLSDGVNTATVAYTAVSGAKATIKAAYGTHPTAGANKMQLIVNSTESTVTDFAGSFPNSDKLSVSWANEEYQAIKSIKFYKEPKHWS